MGWQDVVKNLWIKKSLSATYISRGPVKPFVQNNDTAAQIAERYYEKSLYYHNAIEKIAKVIVSTGFKISSREDVDNKDLDSPAAKKEKKILQSMLENPTKNTLESWEALVYRTISKFLVQGQCGMEVIKGGYPNDTIPDPKSFYLKLVEGFVAPEYGYNGDLNEDVAYKQFYEKDEIPFKIDQLIFFMYPNPFRTWTGQNLIAILASQISMELQSQEFNLNFFANRCIPSGVFKLPEFTVKEEFDAASQRIREAYTSTSNVHSPIVIVNGEVEFTPIQSNPEQVQLNITRGRIAEDIGVTCGSPPATIGYSQKDGKIEVTEVENSFLRYNIPFVQNIFCGAINRYLQTFLKYEFYKLAPKKADIVQDANEMNSIINAVTGGILTPNEGRERFGEEPRDDGQDLMLPMNPQGAVRVADVPGGNKVPAKIPSKPTNGAVKQPLSNDAPPTDKEIKHALEVWTIIKSMREENE